jgi:hypothetical protein
MVRRIANLVIVAVMACALVGAGLTWGMTAAHAAPSNMVAMTHHEHPCEPTASHGGPMSPSQQSLPGCMTDLGCLLLVGIPASPTRAFEHVSWGQVTYWPRTTVVQGIASEPILGPPIRLV